LNPGPKTRIASGRVVAEAARAATKALPCSRKTAPGIHRRALTYFVRSLGLKSSFHLTTGTFNLIVKDRNRLPPERRVFDSDLPAEAGVLEICCPHSPFGP